MQTLDHDSFGEFLFENQIENLEDYETILLFQLLRCCRQGKGYSGLTHTNVIKLNW